MQQSSCCKLPVIFPVALEFCRNGISIFFHTIYMEVQSFIHITLQLIQSLSGRNTGDIFVYRSGCIIIGVINQYSYFAHNPILLFGFPSGLFPNTIQYFLLQCYGRLIVNSYPSLFCRVLELPMAPSLCYQIPAVCFKQVDNFFHLVSSHCIIDGSKI